MHQVSPNEFCMLQMICAWARRLFPWRECDFLFRDGKDTVVGDGNLMGIPSKVFERIAKSVKSFFYVRAPVFAVKIIFERLPLIGIPEFFTGRRENDLSFPVHGIKLGKIFPFKFIPEYPDRNEKLVFDLRIFLSYVRPPPETITVHMHMVADLLVPCMEHLDDAGCRTEILLIVR